MRQWTATNTLQGSSFLPTFCIFDTFYFSLLYGFPSFGRARGYPYLAHQCMFRATRALSLKPRDSCHSGVLLRFISAASASHRFGDFLRRVIPASGPKGVVSLILSINKPLFILNSTIFRIHFESDIFIHHKIPLIVIMRIELEYKLFCDLNWNTFYLLFELEFKSVCCLRLNACCLLFDLNTTLFVSFDLYS